MIRGYMAMSADGFVADRDHGVGWLDRFDAADTGYAAFIEDVSTVVMGRNTFDQVVGFDVGWPYPGKRGLVVTSRPLDSPFPEAAGWDAGVEALVEHLRLCDGDSWIAGGPRLQAEFIARGLLERLDLFVIPVFLGGGVPLFPRDGSMIDLELQNLERFDMGIVRLTYGFPGRAGDGERIRSSE